MITRKIKKNRKGFVLLFAVTLSAMLLAIALGVANIAFNEVKFGTNAKDTNNAFFAADTGAECALLYNKNPTSNTKYPVSSPMTCAGNPPTSFISLTNFWSFTISGLGSEKQGCANVTVDKRPLNKIPQEYPGTIITSNGHNDNGGGCTSGSNTVERQLEVKY